MLFLTKKRQKAMVAQLIAAAKAYNYVAGKSSLSLNVLKRDQEVINYIGDLAYEIGGIDGFLKVNAAFASGDNAVILNNYRRNYLKEEAFYGQKIETVFVHELQREG